MYYEPNYGAKMRNTDRVFVLEPMEGGPKDSARGLVDNNLFTGDNNLHAKLDTTNSQWFLQYDSGTLPPKLKGRWTSFPKLKEHVEQYYNKRNIKVKEVID